ncbi:hypothetical protein SUGI_1097220 [Cryptomeria japonica]|nr:hypothetical protein SUGI_1097220 [Cryptomeria japonica]
MHYVKHRVPANVAWKEAYSGGYWWKEYMLVEGYVPWTLDMVEDREVEVVVESPMPQRKKRSYHEHRRGNQNDHARASIDVATRATRAWHSETCFLLGIPHTMSAAWLVWWYGSLQFATVSVDTRNEMVCNPFEQVRSL